MACSGEPRSEASRLLRLLLLVSVMITGTSSQGLEVQPTAQFTTAQQVATVTCVPTQGSNISESVQWTFLPASALQGTTLRYAGTFNQTASITGFTSIFLNVQCASVQGSAGLQTSSFGIITLDTDECLKADACESQGFAAGTTAGMNLPGTFDCICARGYTGMTCSDIDECEDGTHNCSSDETCQNTPGAFNCNHMDPCLALPHNCDALNAECISMGSITQCRCRPGYQTTGTAGSICEDVDECMDGTHDCPATSPTTTCRNTNGSYQCVCPAGLQFNGMLNNCTDIDECDAMPTSPCSPDAICTNAYSTFQCQCMAGFRGSGLQCENLNECDTPSTNNCDVTSGAALCIDTPGNFFCVCQDGYIGPGTNCTDFDECAKSTTNNCTQTCVNNVGGFSCRCDAGYTGDGYQCSEIPTMSNAPPTTTPAPTMTTPVPTTGTAAPTTTTSAPTTTTPSPTTTTPSPTTTTPAPTATTPVPTPTTPAPTATTPSPTTTTPAPTATTPVPTTTTPATTATTPVPTTTTPATTATTPVPTTTMPATTTTTPVSTTTPPVSSVTEQETTPATTTSVIPQSTTPGMTALTTSATASPIGTTPRATTAPTPTTTPPFQTNPTSQPTTSSQANPETTQRSTNTQAPRTTMSTSVSATNGATATPPPLEQSGGSGDSTTYIAVGVALGAAVLILLIIILAVARKRRERKVAVREVDMSMFNPMYENRRQEPDEERYVVNTSTLNSGDYLEDTFQAANPTAENFHVASTTSTFNRGAEASPTPDSPQHEEKLVDI